MLGERDRPGPEHDQAGGATRPDELAEPPPERCIVGRPGHDGHIRGTREDERASVPLGQSGAGRRDPALDRTGGSAGFRVQDPNGHRAHRHQPSSLVGVGMGAMTGQATAAPRVRAYIGLGANVGDPYATLADAVHSLAALPGSRLRGVSRLYATKPVGVTDQPDFRNAVVAIEVPGGPDPETAAIGLLTRLKELERSAGRRVRGRWGPRELDLDLLVFGRARVRVERPPEARSIDATSDAAAARWLVVPHPAARERLFVLAPLADLAPRLVPPGWPETVDRARKRQLAIEGPDAVTKVGDWDAAAGAWRPTVRRQPR
jgi:2-amino-4-hydroxy-6-hydroxymethyldihydropteridine diphosphokinase